MKIQLNFNETVAFLDFLQDDRMRFLVGMMSDSVEADKNKLENYNMENMRDVGYLQGRIALAREFPTRIEQVKKGALALIEK